MKKKLQKFLNSICPFTILEDEVTWGEFIEIAAKSLIGVVLVYGYYIMFIICADILEVIE